MESQSEIVTSQDLLEIYRQNSHEFEVIADRNAAFLLSFLNYLGAASPANLAEEFNWSRHEMHAAVRLLSEGQFISDKMPGSAGQLTVTPVGRSLLEFMGLLAHLPSQDDAGPPNALIGVSLLVGLALVALNGKGGRRTGLFTLFMGFGLGLGLEMIMAPWTSAKTRDLPSQHIDASDFLLNRAQRTSNSVQDQIETLRNSLRHSASLLTDSAQ